MIIIAHRGNILGPKPQKENSPDYILEALSLGYDVEVDVWFENSRWFLGHDSPEYEVRLDFLKKTGLWCHAKNHQALSEMLKEGVHCFWHEEDKITLTSRGFMWALPGNHSEGSIIVMPEGFNSDISKNIGVCSDYAKKYKLRLDTQK